MPAAADTPAPVDVQVGLDVEATPETLYALVSDVTKMGRWSPETVSADWLDGALAPAVGVRFVGRNRIGGLRWSTRPTIVAAEPGRRFAFTVPGRSGPTWTYTFEPVPGGCRVVESVVQPRRSPLPIRLLQRRAGVVDRREHLRQGMIATLCRLGEAAVAVESRSSLA